MNVSNGKIGKIIKFVKINLLAAENDQRIKNNMNLTRNSI